MAYFLVTHKFNGNRYTADAPSKTQVKKSLPRFNPNGGYMSYFTIEEITLSQYRKHKKLKDVSHAVA